MSRAKSINFLLLCLFLSLSIRLVSMQVLQGKRFRRLSDGNSIRVVSQPGARGKILDRDGDLLVGNKLSYDVLITPGELGGGEKVLQGVSSVLGKRPEELKKVFKGNYASASLPVLIARNITAKQAIALEELKQDTPGIIIQPSPVRFYPHQSLSSHVVGYVNEIDRWRLTELADYGYKTKDIVGFGGVEEKYDYYLRQEEGGLSFEVDHRGRFVRSLGFKEPQNGKDITLTLKLRIQKIAREQLGDSKGCVVLMDPKSGEIFAMASSPTFDPSVFVEKSVSTMSSVFTNPDAPMINRAISATYPPGSIFKVVTASAALETKKLDTSMYFLCQGSLLIGNKKFNCWETHGSQNLVEAIAHSCNVFFYRTGLLTKAQTLHDFALKFGLSRSTGFELPYESAGFIPSPFWRRIYQKKWYDGDTANMSIGQGDVLVTPLQIARVMAVFANNGYLVSPYIVKSIDHKDVSVYQRKRMYLGLHKAALTTIREGLRQAVTLGTGNVLSALPVAVAGKTGTAQAPPGQAHAWFAGFFPYEDPKFVLVVLLDHGGPGYFACVVAQQIIDAMITQHLL